jgi:hypothetical protein
MAQTNFTPIQLYFSTTAAAVPIAGNLANGELAINIVDGKLYYKNSAGTVTLLASTAGSSGDVVGPASATDKAIATFDGTTGKLIQNNSGVTITTGILTATGFAGPLNGTVGATTANTGAFTTLSATGVATFSAGTALLPAITTTGDTNTGIFFPAADTIAFSEGGAESMRIDSSGNVGIGTTSPSGKLDVVLADNGNIDIRQNATNSTGFLSWVDSNGDRSGRISYDHTTDALRFGTAPGGTALERMRIDSDGDVGIGTTTPTSLLQTAGTSAKSAFKTPNIAEVDTISATAATGTINYDVTTQSVLYYTSNASGNFTVNFRGSSGTSLNTMMQTGESISATFLVTNGATAYYNSAVTIDGTSVTPKWQGGTAPTSGNASSIDSYTYVIQKTGSATYVVLASQTKFA